MRLNTRIAICALVVVVGLTLALNRNQRFEPAYVPTADSSRASVSGTVVDRTGAPQSGVAVTWFAHRGDGVYQGGAEVIAASDGTFTLTALEPGEGYIATSQSTPLVEGETRKFAARAGAQAQGIVVQVEEVPEERRISGRVLRSDGAPAAQVSVRGARTSLRGSWSALGVTDARGEFVLVAPWGGGEAELEVLDAGSAATKATVAVGTTALTLRVP